MEATLDAMPQGNGIDVDALTRPFEGGQVKQRPGPGRRPFSYVSGSAVIDRLLEATGSAFSWKVEKAELVTQHTDEGPVSYWVVLGLLSIRGLGVRAGIGTHPAESVEAAKAAETDALKRAAVKFGVGLHLYEEDGGGNGNSGTGNGHSPSPTPRNRNHVSGNGHSASGSRNVAAAAGKGYRDSARSAPPLPENEDDPFA